MRSVSRVGRFAAIGAVLVAVVIVGFILFGGGGGGYTVSAVFENGGQIVSGTPVEAPGFKAGSVKRARNHPERQAKHKISVDGPLHPAPRGAAPQLAKV